MVDIPDLESHPYSQVIAAVPSDSKEYKELEDSLCKLGLHNPIFIYEGMILAGNTRYTIIKSRGDIEPKFAEFKGTKEQALAFAIDDNLKRRVISESERGMAAARLIRTQAAYDNKEKNEEWAADKFDVGRRTVQRALDLFAADRQDLIKAVDQRLLVLRNASPLAKISSSVVQKILESDNPNFAAAKVVKQASRQNRQVEMANNAVAETRETPDRSMRFGVIYADPPWDFETYSEEGKGKSAENHYPVMDLESIKNLNVPSASDCALFLWTTIAHLENAIDVLNAWGFEYKSAYGWHKTKPGTGYWSRNNLELLLLGTKGDVPAPLPEMLGEQCMVAAQGRHSEKPEIFADMITRFFPNVPKAELFARKTDHKGESWYYFGNEVGVEIEVIHKDTPAKGKRSGGKRKTGKVVSSNGQQESVDQTTEQQGKVDIENPESGTNQLESNILQGN